MSKNRKNPKNKAKSKANDGKPQKTTDGYVNLINNTGYGSKNTLSGSTYQWTNLSNQQLLLEAMYGTSWIVGAVIDSIAEDMTRKGIEIKSSNDPVEIQKIQSHIEELSIWDSILDGLKWGRLYGGAIATINVDGQNPATPLRIDSIGKGQFSGLTIFDRWQLTPDTQNVISSGPDAGLPAFYTVINSYNEENIRQRTYHHSRCIRFIGNKMPLNKARANMMWGSTVLQRMFDRLLSFDQLTMSAVNLTQRAYLQTVKIDELRTILAGSDQARQNLRDSFEEMALMQSAQGITLVDSRDQVENFSYNFSGLSDIFLRNEEQLAGAAETPIVRLFKQSPTGLTSTSESDMEQYRDTIHAKQNSALRKPIRKILELIHRSLFGRPLPDDFNFEFRSLKEMDEKDKSDIANSVTNSISLSYEQGLISLDTALQELKQSSDVTGIYTNITDEQIEEAKLAPPPIPDLQNVEPNPQNLPDDRNKIPKRPLDIAEDE